MVRECLSVTIQQQKGTNLYLLGVKVMKALAFKPHPVIWLSSLCVAFFLVPCPGLALTVQEVPNPRQVSGGWVTDKAEILQPETETQLNQMIARLEAKNGAEIAVVTVPETAPAASPKEFTTNLFNYWKIGKKGQDNGVLFLISVKDRRVEIETGYGVEGILPDGKVGNIIKTQITPHFRQKDFDGGTLAGTRAIIVSLEPSLSKELTQDTPQNNSRGERFWMWLGVAIGGGSVIYLILIFRPVYIEPNGRSRTKNCLGGRLHCAICQQPLKLLDLTEVLPYLSETERIAQDIGSINFQGWQCPNCCSSLSKPAFHIRANVSSSQQYESCPTCQELTMKQQETILQPATQYQEGKRRIISICQCCGYCQEREEIIPRLPLPIPNNNVVSSSVSFSGGDSGGRIFSGGDSGGSSFSDGDSGGSSFGGGDSGGGGAGDSW